MLLQLSNVELCENFVESNQGFQIGVQSRLSSLAASLSTAKTQVWYQVRTLWLFTRSDLKTVVFPQTVFGVSVALNGASLTTNESPQLMAVLGRLPKLVLWIWLTLLTEDIANQRLPRSILEDSVNKPWRPLPSRRIKPDGARQMLLWAVPLVYLISLWLGGSNAFVALTVFSYMYNDLDGANEHFLTRNLLNACGLSAIGLGAAEVATGYGEFSIRRNTIEWIAILALVITTTVQMQDLPDVEGDKARERRTFPLVYGDRMARWSVAATVFPWSVLCPYYWKLSVWFYVPSCSLGATIAFRVLYCKTIAQHEVTWKFWCFWMMALYLLPLHARSGQ